jgi:hypothetical protein
MLEPKLWECRPIFISQLPQRRQGSSGRLTFPRFVLPRAPGGNHKRAPFRSVGRNRGSHASILDGACVFAQPLKLAPPSYRRLVSVTSRSARRAASERQALLTDGNNVALVVFNRLARLSSPPAPSAPIAPRPSPRSRGAFFSRSRMRCLTRTSSHPSILATLPRRSPGPAVLRGTQAQPRRGRLQGHPRSGARRAPSGARRLRRHEETSSRRHSALGRIFEGCPAVILEFVKREAQRHCCPYLKRSRQVGTRRNEIELTGATSCQRRSSCPYWVEVC